MTERLDLTSLRSAVTSLAEGVSTIENAAWMGAQTAAVRKILLAGTIQNFEFVYELAFKMIRRQLELEAASPSEVDESSFRDVVRSAAQRGLIDDVEAWFGYRQMRNLTSHTYDQERARQVWKGIPAFLGEARRLLARLEIRNA